jgi:hypothetical protein
MWWDFNGFLQGKKIRNYLNFLVILEFLNTNPLPSPLKIKLNTRTPLFLDKKQT